MPPHQATKYHKGWVGEVLQHQNQPQSCQQHADYEEYHSLLSSLSHLNVCTATLVQTIDISVLYISILHNLLKSRISNLVHNAFRKKDESVRSIHIKIARSKGCFTHDINGGRDKQND